MKSEPLQIPYGGEIDSTALNSWSENVLADLKAATELQQQAQEKASTVVLLQSYENLFLARQRDDLARECRLLRRELQAQSLQSGKADVDISVAKMQVLTGQSLQGYDRVLPLFQTAVDRLPDGVLTNVTVYPAADGAIIRDTALSAAVDHLYDTVWLRSVEVPLDSNITSVEAQVEIQLPQEVPTTRANLIGLLPYPSWGLDVVSISVFAEQDAWVQVQGEVINTGPLLASFTPTHTRRIRIHLRQKNPLLFGDRKLFVLGLRDLLVLSATFGSKVQLKSSIQLPQTGMWVQGVTVPGMDASTRLRVSVDGSDVLPVHVTGDSTEIEVIMEGDSLEPVGGLTVHLAR